MKKMASSHGHRSHNHGIPDYEIWIKLGGDHGRDSFKLTTQIVNSLTPNSKHFTVLIAMAKVKDTPDNLKIIFADFKDDFLNLANAVWKNNRIKLFMFGDYHFSVDVFGISGASGKHPCLCLN